MHKMPEIFTVSELRKAYLAKQLKPAEVMDEILLRTEKHKKKNIFISPPQADRIVPYLQGLETMDMASHPLWGIPFAVKDNIDVAGFSTTAACPDYQYIPRRSAAVVERLIEAGAFPVGKTNLDQFATGLVGTRSPYGEVHNAFRDELISGGSSSGSAVAVALGMAAFALGTDTAGSGRVPAALNGLFGFKPSCGAWPTAGVVPACASIDCVSVFAHSMDDCLTVDALARSFTPADPWSRKMPPLTLQRPRHIFIPEQEIEFFGRFAEEYRSAWQKSLAILSKTALEMEKIDCSLLDQAASILYGGPWVAERWADLGDFVEKHPGKTLPVTEKILRSGAGQDAASLFRVRHTLQKIKAKVRSMLTDAVLVMPTTGGTWLRQEVAGDPVDTNTKMGRYTNHCNLLDLCACSIPGPMAGERLPFGITIFALAGAEGLLAGLCQLL